MITFFYLSIFTIFFMAILNEILQKDFLLHMAQLSNYRYYEFSAWFFKIENLKKYRKNILSLIFSFLPIIIFSIFIRLKIFENWKIENLIFNKNIFNYNLNFNLLYILTYICFTGFYLILLLSLRNKKQKIKKPLVYTKRALRLKSLYWLIYLIFLVIFTYIILMRYNYLLSNIFSKVNNKYYPDINNNFILLENYFQLLIFVTIYSFFINLIINFTPLIMLISQFIIEPLEKLINNKFLFLAKSKINRLKENGLLVIGITGSYGKTSTKFYLKTILEKNFEILFSSSSFNTPMGLSKTINESINEKHRIFIAEMGARYRNDISDLVELCKPDIGILTAIGPVHLETFKTIKNIQEEKWKLVGYSKIGLINIDNDLIYDKFQDYINTNNNILLLDDRAYTTFNYIDAIKDQRKYIVSYGSKKERNPLFRYDNIKIEEDKRIFDINIGSDKTYRFETRLLGRHNIENLCGVISCAFLFKIDYNRIFEAVKNIEPVEHRLQLIKPNENLIIIDDAFNSNPDSAKAAISVLSEFSDRKKIIVTPGFIELGKVQYEKNKEFGKLISENVDFTIFVGKTNKNALIEGYKSVNNNERYYFAENLEDATKYLSGLYDKKSVVLFENDLPDNYEN